MSMLLINASIRGEDSVSRTLSTKLAEKLSSAGAGDIKVRELNQTIPLITQDIFAANNTVPDKRSDEQKALAGLADTLIEELQDADTIVIGAPVYNFGPPAVLKAWADLVARAGATFQYSASGPEGLLTGKKAYIAAVSGGTPIGSDIDFMSGWLTFFLGFLGITDVEIITADGIMGEDGEEKIQAAHAAIDKIAA